MRGEMRSIYWTDDSARLASFSASAKGNATVVRIELKVIDPDRMGWIMSALAEIKKNQGTVTVDVEDDVSATQSRRRGIDRTPQLLLTDRKGK